MNRTAFKALRTFTAVSAAAFLIMGGAARAAPAAGDTGILPAQAADAPEYDLPPAGEETHPMIRLTPDKPQIVRLDSDARSIIVGNPANLNAVMDTVRSLVLIPRDPGATHITIIGKDGKVIMQRYVIVAGPAEKYIRVRRTCAGTSNCAETTVYYCPDMCHETKILSSAMGQPQKMPTPLPMASVTYTGQASPAPAASGTTASPAPAEDSGTVQAPEPAPAPEGSGTSPSKEP